MPNALYLSIVDDIKKKIVSGSLKPEDMLRSESGLMKEYKVSRMTIRKSLSLLSNEGYIYSIPGKGNYIRKPDSDTYQFRFNEYDNLVPEVEEIKLLSVKIERPSVNIMQQLLLHEEDQVVRIERLIFGGGEAVALEIIYTGYIPNMPIIEDKLSFANFTKAIELKHSFSLRKELTIKFELPDKEIRGKLNLKEHENICLVSRKTIKTDTESPLTYSIFYIKKDSFVLTAKTPEHDEGKKIF